MIPVKTEYFIYIYIYFYFTFYLYRKNSETCIEQIFSISIYCRTVKKTIYILYLDYVLFIWHELDECIYIRLSYCKAKLK